MTFFINKNIIIAYNNINRRTRLMLMKIRIQNDDTSNERQLLDLLNQRKFTDAFNFLEDNKIDLIDFRNFKVSYYDSFINLSLYNPMMLICTPELNLEEFKKLCSLMDYKELYYHGENITEEELKELYLNGNYVVNDDRRLSYYIGYTQPIGYIYESFIECYKKINFYSATTKKSFEELKKNFEDIFDYITNEQGYKIKEEDYETMSRRFYTDIELFYPTDIIVINNLNIPEDCKNKILTQMLYEIYKRESYFDQTDQQEKRIVGTSTIELNELKKAIKNILGNDKIDYSCLTKADKDDNYLSFLLNKKEYDNIFDILENQRMDLKEENHFFAKLVKSFIKENDKKIRNIYEDMMKKLIICNLNFKKESDYGRYKTETLFDFIHGGITEESFEFFNYSKGKRQLSRGDNILKVIETTKINYEKETLHSLFNNNDKKVAIKSKKRL